MCVVTTTPGPSSPDTGYGTVQANPLRSLAVVVGIVSSLLILVGLSRKYSSR